jgi:Phosphotransferase enzyme family
MTGRSGYGRVVVTGADLAGLARAAFGAQRRLTGVSRLRGGSKKGVYRLTLDDGLTAVAYLWADEENYWPGSAAATPPAEYADPFSHASGLALFEAAHRELEAAGVRVPRVYLADRSGRRYPADAAIVEDVAGPSLEERLERDPAGGEPALDRLAVMLDAMYQRREARFGKVAFVRAGGAVSAPGGAPLGRDSSLANGSAPLGSGDARLDAGGDAPPAAGCELVVLDRARADLGEAAARDERIGQVRDQLDALLLDLARQVRPRAEYRLIHGELGPDHVLVDGQGEPVLVDIEGLMFFDAEWEHVFLRIRFGHRYPRLARAGLDERRLALYDLAVRLSLVAGPLRLLDGPYPDRAEMLEIAEYNLRAALAILDTRRD